MTWTWRKGITAVIGLFFLTVIAWALIEIALFHVRPPMHINDELLGWKLNSNVNRVIGSQRLDGSAYNVAYQTNSEGLRTVGDDKNARVKILVLGDSFTVGPYASNDEMWYSKMVERLAAVTKTPLADYYVVAGGGGGYGTYQELLVAETLAKEMRPTLLILQFCSNDFASNHRNWEGSAIVRSQSMRRPYWDPESQKASYQAGCLPVVYRSFLGQSRLLNAIDGLIQGIQFKMYGGYGRPLPKTLEDRYEAESVSITRYLLKAIRHRFAGVPAVMVNCDGDPSGLNGLWLSLAEEGGYVPVAAPSDFLNAARAQAFKDEYHADGGHLSDRGNRVYGERLADALLSLKIPALTSAK
jgi:lysophospholipase L1-like esterase